NLILDGMVTNEALSCLLAAAVIVVAPPLVAPRDGERVAGRALATGALLALGLLTKVSALVVMAALGLGALGDQATRRGAAIAERLRRFAPVGVALGVGLGGALPVYAWRNRPVGHLFATAFEWYEPVARSPVALNQAPYLDRRSLGYVFGLGPHVTG